MAVFVRIMEVHPDGGPVVGDMANQLGARHPGSPRPPTGRAGVDITPDGQGLVQPGKRGMSLFRKGVQMPAHLTIDLTGAPGQLGKFGIADDPYPTRDLSLHITNPDRGHAVMAPTVAMLVSLYQLALSQTRPQWSKSA